MNGELVYDSAVEFLDQFIERGAAGDVLQLRDRLVSDERTKKLLLDQLPSQDVDERGAFDAFRRFLSAELEQQDDQDRTGGPDLVLLLSWTDWEDDGLTSDPAQWHDWLGAVAAAGRAV